ncbi:hypothetical protein VKT23_014410 [Stygiomarasmius scandens]|uniref:Uncharacterized protein n=1 Tax=Marasmiellus scandens TaxID=2682957 RepID=A0ABR1J0T9_9AGAR
MPISLENIICKHPHVSAALIFGRARPCLGVIIQLVPTYHFNVNRDPKDDDPDSVLSWIWPAVEEVNQVSPTFARIEKEMVIFTHDSKPFLYTQKGAPKRPVALLDYQEEIDSAYRRQGAVDLLDEYNMQSTVTLQPSM